jgi:hypothetical protein
MMIIQLYSPTALRAVSNPVMMTSTLAPLPASAWKRESLYVCVTYQKLLVGS